MGHNAVNIWSLLYRYPTADNFIYRLSYRWTVCLLLAFFVIITCKLTFSSTFSCSTSYDNFPTTYLNTKCYYSEPLLSDTPFGGDDLPSSSGIGKREQSYYPWVNLVFLTQALIFYLPHLLWKSYESGYIGKLTAGLHMPLHKEHKRSLELSCLAKYLKVSSGRHRMYTLMYLCSEVLNCVIAVGQIIWLVQFFNVTGVPEFVPADLSWSSYRRFYFPPSATCTLMKNSASGVPMKFGAMCVLGLNHLYMIMFLVLRGWYILLVMLTGVVVVYRVLLLLPMFRSLGLRSMCPMIPKSSVHSICHQLSYSDWFFLTAVRKFLTDADFSKLIDKMLACPQNKDLCAQRDDSDRSSVYEDTHKELDVTPITTPL